MPITTALDECEGYRQEPRVGDLWPGETSEDFGYPHSLDGTRVQGSGGRRGWRMTNCERCCAEVEDDDVQMCDECGQDGLCEDCMGDHTCESEAGDDQPTQA